MGSEGARKSVDRVLGVLRPAGTVLAGAAAVLLVWAAALGAWARLIAPRSSGEGSWYVIGLHRWGGALPNRMALAVAVIAVVLIAAMAYSVWRGRTGRDLSATPAGAAGVAALLFIAYVTQGIPAFYQMAMDSAPVTAALPAGMASWWLCLAGAAVTFLAARAFPRLERSSVRLLAVGVAIAVVVAAVVTVGALRAGDDGRYVDATTAAATDVPAVPSMLGQRTFTVSVPDAFEGNKHDPNRGIVAAGAGFVVYGDHRITAYGADGKERWHFARTGPGGVVVNGMRVFDNGATVVAFLDKGLVGIDATTGERLWTSADDQMMYALSQVPGYNLDAPFVVYRDDRVWVRFDTRTGKPMWTVPAPHADCDFPPRVVDTRSWLVSVVRCSSEQSNAIRVIALDPGSGETVWDNEVFKGQADAAAIATPANAVGIFIQFGGAGAPPGIAYANVVDKTVTPLPARGTGEPSLGPSDNFVFSGRDGGRQLVLFGPDGKQRCAGAQGIRGAQTRVLGQGGGLAYLSFAGGFVVADDGGVGTPGSLRTFDANTCAQTAAVPAESVEGFVPVPGAVLVLRRDGQTLQIDGYTA
ncbi:MULTISPECIES: PQQ-binding-like beta-propeller repeat protein [unclassified Mycolicibacterium]|uniref:outer membrane protein assembly factor BamB family protein n=1 Tax=unclassified Mycolicibacterium TaxID=2636767 RepID=UPI0012DC07C1|nr:MULTISPECIES: PQQ-binding-like beta-propeller repeat protein [unclassified Mycolicibacterium]MUL81184.1 PQQ-binding-like beta-propeller repeat protein [Mycolicibacterium sp. CBMA 329]MUL86950.1 PQQ-binding-like beta-propeller repeat protein [Mycolicibacterium sp. CBMA 331]MUL98766.1 PQQ-binding-like beta-propeller repeat protein [Mycolicibacterium sp. CBMA 334]MUM37247.1 PQQ-binding-like beta-propeller repeat protein [Mycolicibacterium sp. CBMA 247]MUM43015.1 PQQ-binding-like beta-propeller